MLASLSDRYGTREFDSGQVASALDLRKKLVSNDLRRLYRMGFLKRRRVKRSCFGRRGFCNRGFGYMYSFSRHGLSYVEWLRMDRGVEDFAAARLRSDAILRLPDDVKKKVLAVQMVEELKPYRGPGSTYRPSPSDLLLNAYVNDNYERLLGSFREIAKESVHNSVTIGRLNSEKESLYSENQVLNIINHVLEQERDHWKKQTNEMFWAGSKALVEDSKKASQTYRLANQLIEHYHRFLIRIVTYLYLLFPSKAVDQLIDHAWELEKASMKPIAIQKKPLTVEKQTEPRPSTPMPPPNPVTSQERKETKIPMIEIIEIDTPGDKALRAKLRSIATGQSEPNDKQA